MVEKLSVTISKTADGKQDYMQVMTADLRINLVLIADEIILTDLREESDAASNTD